MLVYIFYLFIPWILYNVFIFFNQPSGLSLEINQLIDEELADDDFLKGLDIENIEKHFQDVSKDTNADVNNDDLDMEVLFARI